MKTFLCLLLAIPSFAFAAPTFPSANSGAKDFSVARVWDEALLQAIRLDYARPTVAARNLFHLSVVLYDSWAVYEKNAANYFINFKRDSENLVTDRNTTINYAAFHFLNLRLKNHPKHDQIINQFRKIMTDQGLDPDFETAGENSAAEAGNTIGEMVFNNYYYDGALEDANYVTPATEYPLLNPPMIVKLSGVGNIYDINYWQPLALDKIIDQGGNPLPAKITYPLTLHWGRLTPFAMEAKDRNPNTGLYFDPGLPPQFAANDEQFRNGTEQMIEFSSWLDPKDNLELDISPASLGNNPLGTNDGMGHELNPISGKPYNRQIVKRGDYARVLAEFWADGPNSETPPGHWNVLANYVADQPQFLHQWMGMGSKLPRLEWDVKMYLTLNGALHDAAIAAWGIKGYYQGSRPISAVRYLGLLGQASDPALPNFNKNGLHLKDGLVELITSDLTAPGQKFAHLIGHEGELAVRSWLGAPADPQNTYKGVGWILAADWLPYQRPTFVTPPFPGYISGHSTYSRAGAEVMTAITGSKFFPGGMAEFTAAKNAYLVFEDGPSQTLSLQWATYYDAADQCSLSRIFGGIHSYFDDFPGRKIGSLIGRKAVGKTLKLFYP